MLKKQNINSMLRSITITIFCLFGAAFFYFLLQKDINASIIKENAQPIAYVATSSKIAQRRFIDRVLWDRIQKDSPLYDGDTVLTMPNSQALITFVDNSITIDLFENSLIQIYADKEKNKISLQKGNVSVKSNNKNTSIESGNNIINVNTGLLSLRENNGKTSYSLTEGDAQLLSGGKNVKLVAGQTITADSHGISQKTEFGVKNPPAYIVPAFTNTAPVTFSWTAEKTDEKEIIIIETCNNFSFINDVRKYEIETVDHYVLNVPVGTLFWKAYTQSNPNNIYSGKIVVEKVMPVIPLAPKFNSIISYENQLPIVIFMWKANALEAVFELTVADNPELNNPVVKMQTVKSRISLNQFNDGTWYWQVKTKYEDNQIPDENTRIASFTIQKTQTLAPAVVLYPTKSVPVNLSENHVINFTWAADPNATQYRLTVADNPDLYKPLFSVITPKTSYDYTVQKDTVQEGSWYSSVVKLNAQYMPISQERAQEFIVKGSVTAKKLPPELILPQSVLPQEKTALLKQTPIPESIVPITPIEQKIEPANNTQFDEQYLLETKSVQFTWQKIPDASEYVFTLFKDTKKVLEKHVKTPEFSFPDIKALGNGQFSWNVTALVVDPNSDVIKIADAGKGAFTIVFPHEKIEIKRVGEQYAR